jgi:hypothetical protein
VADTIGKFLGNTVGEAAAFAAGIAVGPLLAPLLRALESETWAQYPDMPIAAQTMAQGVAEHKIDPGVGAKEALLTGFSGDAFKTLVDIVKTSPGVAEGLTLIRRGQLTPDDFLTVLQKAGLEDQWIAAYQKISANGLTFEHVPLPAPDVALGMVRNNVRNQDSAGAPIFPPGLDSTGSTIAQHPPPDIDPQAEAEMSGYDLERFTVLANNVGLPPGVIEGLSMLNRGYITEADFALLIEQSDTRIAWGPALLKLARMILTPHEYAELRLRNWITDPEMYAGTALHGLTTDDTDLLLKNIGRPLAVHQVTTGLARGGTFPGVYANVPSPFKEAIAESNIREEYSELAYANRYTLPSAFVLKALATAGDLTFDETHTLLLETGWPPDLAESVAKVWTTPAATTTTAPTKSATTSAIKAVGKAYIAGNTTQATAEAELTSLGEDPSTFAGLFAAWDVNRKATLQGKTNVQIRNLYRNLGLTEAEGVSILEDRGLSAADATAYLTG